MFPPTLSNKLPCPDLSSQLPLGSNEVKSIFVMFSGCGRWAGGSLRRFWFTQSFLHRNGILYFAPRRKRVSKPLVWVDFLPIFMDEASKKYKTPPHLKTYLCFLFPLRSGTTTHENCQLRVSFFKLDVRPAKIKTVSIGVSRENHVPSWDSFASLLFDLNLCLSLSAKVFYTKKCSL